MKDNGILERLRVCITTEVNPEDKQTYITDLNKEAYTLIQNYKTFINDEICREFEFDQYVDLQKYKEK